MKTAAFTFIREMLRHRSVTVPGPQGSTVMTLKEDMLTIKTEPKALMPDVRNSQGTGFEGREFFEASSIRRSTAGTILSILCEGPRTLLRGQRPAG